MAGSRLLCKPVGSSHTPQYPTRLKVLANPELLEQTLPVNLNLSKEYAALAALFLGFGAGSCSPSNSSPNHSDSAVTTAPVFEHGDGIGYKRGYGYWGCIAVSPPVYVSEDEALKVIISELQRHGVNITEREKPLPGVLVPSYDAGRKKDWTTNITEACPRSIPFSVDMTDTTQNIWIEFISKEEEYGFPTPHPIPSSLVNESNKGKVLPPHNISFTHVGSELVKTVESQCREKLYFAVLYDPAPSVYYSASQEVKNKRSLEPIRKQIKDLIQWLEAQGAL